MRAVSENDGLAGVEFGGAVGVAPERVEPRCWIDARQTRPSAVAADFLRQAAQDAVENDGFHFCKEPLGRYFIAVGVLDAGEPGESTKARTDAGNYNVGAGNALVPKRFNSLLDDGFKFGLHVGFVGAGGIAVALAAD